MPLSIKIFSTIGILIIFVPEVVLAEQIASNQPHWWQVVAGVIAIPAGILGLFYSIVLIRKTHLEARKTALEIEEKQETFRSDKKFDNISEALVQPIFQGQRVQFVLIRFVLLSVGLFLWGLLEQVYGWVLGGTYLAFQQLTDFELSTENPMVIIPAMVLLGLPKVGEWILILGLGLPIFRETTDILGISIKDLLFPWRSNK